jgi:phage-related tail protein
MEFISGLISGVADAVSGLINLFGDAKDASSGVNAPSTSSSGKFAVGTSYFRGGTATIHERGAEVVDLPKGTRIWPHSDSLKMAYNEGKAEGGGKGGNVTINIPKLADSINVRNDSDIESIAVAIANKLEQVALNIGGGELGYLY